MAVRRHWPAADLTRIGLWVFLALMTGAAVVRISTTQDYLDARLDGPHVIRPASVRGL